eukprot:scaffold80407_cov36-Tisochrysis_lutea.AAC.2
MLQFGTASDYADLISALSAAGHPVAVAPLKLTDWLRLIPASLTAEYWQGKLTPEVALPFYFEALDEAIEQLEKEWPGRKTRGLLSYVEERYPGAAHPELRYLTVGSRAVKGAKGFDIPSCGESLGRVLAAASYLPLCGDGTIEGDGITPISCAHLPGAEQREGACRRLSVLPLLPSMSPRTGA